MRQKYFISLETVKDKLNIKEYAIVQKALKNESTSMLLKEKFAFLGEETYDNEIIKGSIKRGVNALVRTLRTRNLFPIGPYAVKIAESVMELYASEGHRSVELFFDDLDQLVKNPL